MKILILGGTGAMGAELTEILGQAGHDVFVTSRSKRESAYTNVRYLCGDAHDMTFLKEIMEPTFDAIVDFMAYKTEEFRARVELLRSSTKQYVFLSSSRVYAPAEAPLTEESPRLIDACKNQAYLQTDDYPLAKARQEDILAHQMRPEFGAYTIVRPYITYNRERLQLGIYEKELWLYRALKGKTVVFPKEMAKKQTTLTHGRDVAAYIAQLIGNERAYGQAVQIAMESSVSWAEALEIYQRAFERKTGKRIMIRWADGADELAWVSGKYAQIFEDRMTNRSFNSDKLYVCCSQRFEFAPVEKKLGECLQAFIDQPTFRKIPWRMCAWMDRKTGEKTNLSEIASIQSKLIYVSFRYAPMKLLRIMLTIYRECHRIHKA